jgi:biopolymer transport protein ExbD
MKFPRHARIFRGQLDAAPFASVFFLLLIFVLMGSMVYTPGVRVELPRGDDLPGPDQPTVAVAVDASGRFYFENKVIDRNQLQARLQAAVTNSAVPLTLLVQGDKAVTEESLVNLWMLARSAGFRDLWLATLPPLFTNAWSLDASRLP